MDYGALPPEVNSGRMYVGPGAAPMLSAATAWDGLASDLFATAAAHGSAISELTSAWSGPASTSMAAAAAPYVAWLTGTAAQAEQTAIQAKAAAAAYEAAFAMTVPPPVIAANRVQLMTLIATNFFGQNLPAIAANEAHYAEMWAQDATAMYAYAGASAGASALTTFDQPPATTNPAGPAAQAAAVAHAADTAAGTSTQSLSSVPAALQTLTLPTSSSGTSTTSGLVGLQSILRRLFGASSGSSGSSGSSWDQLEGLWRSLYLTPLKSTYYQSGNYEHFMKLWEGMSPKAASSKGAEIAAGLPGLGGLPGGGAAPAGASASVAAGAGNGGTVGKLSVPPSWAAAAPATNAASTASPVGATAPAADARGLLRGIPLMPGTGTGQRAGGQISQRYGFRHSVMARPLGVG